MVARRVIPLLVALAVAVAPAALEVCQVRCLSLEAATAGSTPGHHHHLPGAPDAAAPTAHVHQHAALSHTPPSAGLVVSAVPHPCDHGNAVPTVASTPTSILVLPAVLASTFIPPDVELRRAPVPDTAPSSSSENIALTTQLRV
jgi:hypothetical protein